MLAPYFQQSNHLLVKRPFPVRYFRFDPPATISNGEGLRTQGDRYQIYNVDTGEVLLEGDYVEVVAST